MTPSTVRPPDIFFCERLLTGLRMSWSVIEKNQDSESNPALTAAKKSLVTVFNRIQFYPHIFFIGKKTAFLSWLNDKKFVYHVWS